MLRSLARLIAPPDCVVCGRQGRVVCQKCVDEITTPSRPGCFACGRADAAGATCPDCRKRSSLDGVTVASQYAGTIKELIRLLKYRRQRDAALVLAQSLAPLLRADFDVITAVPVATNHLRRRGYNQAELIAGHLSRQLALPYSALLHRRRNVQQVGKSRAERLAQVEMVFAARGQPPARILLVDDVMTTGATLGACAGALKAAGAQTVWAAVAARD